MNTKATSTGKTVRLTSHTSVDPREVEKLSELDLIGRKGTSIHIKGSKKPVNVDMPIADVAKALDYKPAEPEAKAKSGHG